MRGKGYHCGSGGDGGPMHTARSLAMAPLLLGDGEDCGSNVEDDMGHSGSGNGASNAAAACSLWWAVLLPNKATSFCSVTCV